MSAALLALFLLALPFPADQLLARTSAHGAKSAPKAAIVASAWPVRQSGPMPSFPHRAIPIALAAVLIDTIGFGVVIPVLPRLVTQLGHVDMAKAATIGGWLLATFAITQFFAGPIIGNLSDRFGRRPVLIAAMLAFGIDYGLMAWAPTLAWLFLGRAIAGVAGAIYAPASSVLADVTPPEKRSATFGLIGAAFGIGFILGPALGGLIAQLGPRAPFIAASVMALINAVLMMTIMPETLAPENRRPFRLRDAHIVGAFRPLFTAGKAGPLLLAWLLWQLAHNVYYATWSFWAAITFGWDSTAIGWSLAFSGLVMATVHGWSERQGNRSHRRAPRGRGWPYLWNLLILPLRLRVAWLASLCAVPFRRMFGFRVPLDAGPAVAHGRCDTARRAAGWHVEPWQHRDDRDPADDDQCPSDRDTSRLSRRCVPACLDSRRARTDHRGYACSGKPHPGKGTLTLAPRPP